MLATFGSAGTGLHLATTAVASIGCIDVRLVWANAPTLFLRSPVPGVGHHGFASGSTFDHVVMGAPGSLVALVGDLQWSAPVTLPFASGQWWVLGVTLGLDIVGSNGEAMRTYPIPPSPQFVGQQIAFQSLVLDATTSLFAFTNAADCFVGP